MLSLIASGYTSDVRTTVDDVVGCALAADAGPVDGPALDPDCGNDVIDAGARPDGKSELADRSPEPPALQPSRAVTRTDATTPTSRPLMRV